MIEQDLPRRATKVIIANAVMSLSRSCEGWTAYCCHFILLKMKWSHLQETFKRGVIRTQNLSEWFQPLSAFCASWYLRMGIQMDPEYSDWGGFFWCELAFTSLLLLEVAIRFMILGWRQFFCGQQAPRTLTSHRNHCKPQIPVCQWQCAHVKRSCLAVGFSHNQYVRQHMNRPDRNTAETQNDLQRIADWAPYLWTSPENAEQDQQQWTISRLQARQALVWKLRIQNQSKIAIILACLGIPKSLRRFSGISLICFSWAVHWRTWPKRCRLTSTK